MNNLNITVNDSIINNIKFYLYRSPSNNIKFIKNKSLNMNTKRLYVDAKVLINTKIKNNDIIDYFKDKHIDLSEIAYLSFIKNNVKYLYSRKNNERKLFTFIAYSNINNNLVNTTSKNINKYKNNRLNGIVFSKGYGKKLLLYIENYLKGKGYKYLFLLPISKILADFYLKLGYKEMPYKVQDTKYMYKEL